jgi:hypothetical protein
VPLGVVRRTQMIRNPERVEAERLGGANGGPPALPAEPLLGLDQKSPTRMYQDRVGSVTAPCEADETIATYLANTPVVYLGAGARQSRNRC